jgi:hypothetical protein
MIVFIVSSLLLAILVQNHYEGLQLLTTPVGLSLSMSLLIASLVVGYFKKRPTIQWHDAFATASLLVWYGYWRPQFNDDTPMFFVFPLYFTFMASMLTLGVINKSIDFDLGSIEYLRYVEKLTRVDFSVNVAFVFIGLLVTKHYALYPMAMTFFFMRHTFIVCSEIIEQNK